MSTRVVRSASLTFAGVKGDVEQAGVLVDVLIRTHLAIHRGCLS